MTTNVNQETTILHEEKEKVAPAATAQKEENNNSSDQIWRSVMIGGIPGIIIGAGATVAADAVASPVHQDDPIKDDDVVVEVRVATSVNDDMTFSEAFASARAEVGPGGAFVWHGNVYGTYRGDDVEWQEMSAEDRAAHSRLIMSQVHRVPYHPADPINDNHVVDNTEGGGSGDVESEVDVHIVSVQAASVDGVEVIAGFGEYNGHSAAFVDTTGDGEVDTVIVDENNDGLDANDPIYHSSGLSVNDMYAQAENNSIITADNSLMDNMPDYTNDAEVSSLT